MTVTGRHTSRKVTTGKAALSATQSGEEIARAARVAELRRLVATGRYRVESHTLAMRILSRALQRR